MAGEKLNAEQLAEGEALAKAATKGPWEVTYGSDSPAGHGPTFEFAYAELVSLIPESDGDALRQRFAVRIVVLRTILLGDAKTGDANAYTIAAICESLGPNIGSSISESVRQIKARAESAEREREEMRVALQFYAEGKCRCGVEYQAGERARAALKGGK